MVFLTVVAHDQAYIEDTRRLETEHLRDGVHRVTGRYGFMETPNVPELLRLAKDRGLRFDDSRVTYFLSKETILSGKRPGMRRWRKKVFAFMSRNATSAAAFFRLPPNRVVELGMQVEV